MGLTIASILME